MEEQKIYNLYWTQEWNLDFYIYHGYSNLTDEELEKYTNELREALTANDTFCYVALEDCVISILGFAGGDSTYATKILFEMCKRGYWLEKDICYDEKRDV